MSKEAVNHPQYYGGENNQYEAIKVIEACPCGSGKKYKKCCEAKQ